MTCEASRGFRREGGMSDIKHLACLSMVKSMASVRQLTSAAFPGNHCPMHTALSLGARIEGLSTLVIGTAECGYYSRNVPFSSPYADQGIHWTYLLGDREVVFGCREGLREAKSATRTVNILGRAAHEDHTPLPRILAMLEDLRMPLRFLAPNASLDDFASAGDACLNIVLSPFMDPLAERIKREHDIPFVSLHGIYDVTKIDAAYLHIETLMGVKMPAGWDERRNQARELQKEALGLLDGLRYISANIGALQALPLSTYLASMGMSPIMVHMEEFYPSDMRWRQALLEQEENPIICLMLNEQVDRAIIETLYPDVMVGDWGGRSGLRAPTVQVLDLYGQAGYERTITLLKRMMKAALSAKEGSAHGIA